MHTDELDPTKHRHTSSTERLLTAVTWLLVAAIVTLVLTRVDLLSDVGILKKPAPREIPVAVTGPVSDAEITRDALNTLSGNPVQAVAAPDYESGARSLVSREVVGVLELDDNGQATLHLSGAGGQAEATELSERITTELESSGRHVTVVDDIPPVSGDADGSASGRLAVGWVLFAIFAAMIITRVYENRPAKFTRAVLRIVAMLGLSLAAAAVGVIIGLQEFPGLSAHMLELFGFGTLITFAVGLSTMAFITWLGRAGAVVALVIYIVIGVPGAVGAYPLAPLPSVATAAIAWLPPATGAWAVRGIAYFDSSGIMPVVLLYTVWSVLGAAFLIVGTTTDSESHTSRQKAQDRLTEWRLHPALRSHQIVSKLIGVAVLAAVFLTPAALSFNPEPPKPALRLTCAPFSPPSSVDDLNAIVDGYRNQQLFTGADVGASTVLSDGRELFVFGDTLRGESYDTNRMVRNSMLVFGPGCAGIVHNAKYSAAIPDRDGEVGYWPMSIINISRQGNSDIVLVTAQRVRRTGDGAFDFENLGPAVAQFRVADGGVPVLQRVEDIGEDSSDPSRPTWGAASALEEDHLYLYGTSSADPSSSYGWALSVARAPIDDVWNRAAWEFWDGRSWQADESAAAELIGADGGVSQTLSVFEQDGTWYALSKQGDFLGSDLVVWTADSPQGRFVEQPPVAQIPSTDLLRYMPLAHPELLPEPGSVIVSYSRNTDDQAAITADPTLYRPMFMRVPLPTG